MQPGFVVQNRHFRWGITLAELAVALPDSNTGRKVWIDNWPDLVYPGPQRPFGLPAVLAEARAPAANKPVMQVIYGLTAPAENSAEKPADNPAGAADPTIWLRPLQLLLGPATRQQAHPESRQHGASGVVYSAEWRLDAARLGLSVYGGPRQELGGTTAAGLFLSWTDEIAAARPYYEVARAQAAALAAVAGQGQLHHLARLGEPQRPYRMGATQKLPADLLRQSQRALYRTGLCETPAAIRALLPSDHLAGLWSVPQSAGQWALSTQYDTVVFAPATQPVGLHMMRPAKGGGGLLLDVGSLTLADAYGTDALEKLAAALGALGAHISRTEDYDC